MAQRLPQFARGEPVSLRLEGKPIRGYSGESVAVALFASNARVLSRSLKYHRPRGFFCLDGHCGACLMRIDGIPNLRACMERCRPDLTLEGQNAYPSPEMDVLGAVDWMFPSGMDHHTLMTGSRILNKVVNKVVRQLSGLGQLPDRPAESIPAPRALSPDVAVIGGGPAGLAAATAAAQAGATTWLFDEQERPGGSLRTDPRSGPAEADRLAAAARAAGVQLASSACAIAYYPDEALIAVATPDQLIKLTARAVVHATGGYSQNRLFANNDRPGVLAARAVGRLLVEYGVVAAHRVCLVGDGAYPDALAGALEAAGSEVIRIDGVRDRVLRARGRTWVHSVEVQTAAGRRSKLACDLVAVWSTPAPASDAARQQGCTVELSPGGGGFAVVADGDGRTSIPAVLACGDVCGYVGPDAAASAGARAGRVAAEIARS